MKRPLGRSGLQVSALGMGCWAIGGPWTMRGNQAGWGDVDDAESTRAIHRALDLGITFFDTAANYGCGHSERVLGRALACCRDQVVIATKFGYNVDEETKSAVFYGDDQDSAEVVRNLRRDCEASLRRLNTDYIDLYQFHINAYSPSKAAAVRDTLEELVAEDRIRYYGWSTDNPEGARVFSEGPHCAAIQHSLNVMHDAPEILDVCERFGLASINRGPLAKGILTGKYAADAQFARNDIRSSDTFRRDSLLPGLRKLQDISEVLTSGGRTPAQGALAWIWARSRGTIPIPGIRTVAQATENTGAMNFGPLNESQMGEIDRLLGGF